MKKKKPNEKRNRITRSSKASRKGRGQGKKNIARSNPKGKVKTKNILAKTTKLVSKAETKLPGKSVSHAERSGKSKQVVEFKKAETRTSLKNNLLTIDLQTNKKLASKIAAINDWSNKETNKFRDKYADQFPRGYQVILTTRKGRKDFHQMSKISFEAVTPENVKKGIKDSIMEFQDKFYEVLEANDGEPTDSSWTFDPSKISRVTVRYFYASEK